MTQPHQHVVSTCSTCAARIIWCRTITGKRMPVDVDPVPDGNLLLTDELLPTAQSVGRVAAKPGQLLYKSHFASCRQAAKHRHPSAGATPAGGRDLFGGGRR